MTKPTSNNKKDDCKPDTISKVENRMELSEVGPGFKEKHHGNIFLKSLSCESTNRLQIPEFRAIAVYESPWYKKLDAFTYWALSYIPFLEVCSAVFLLLVSDFNPAANLGPSYRNNIQIFVLASTILRILSVKNQKTFIFSIFLLIPCYAILLMQSAYNLDLVEIASKTDPNADNVFKFDEKTFYLFNGLVMLIMFITNSVFSIFFNYIRNWQLFFYCQITILTSLKVLFFDRYAAQFVILDLYYAAIMGTSKLYYLREDKIVWPGADWKCLIGIAGFVLHGLIFLVAYVFASFLIGASVYEPNLLNHSS